MADQQRWFKLWASAPSDDGLQRLAPALRWAWAVFGVYTKVHGNKGIVTVSPTNAALAAEMCVTPSDVIPTIKVFPHMHIDESENRHGEVTVTWHNWVKYQVDSTQAKRAQASRSKKRGEERRVRGEEKPLAIAKGTTLSGKPDESHEVLNWLNAKTGKGFRPVKTNLDFIRARLTDGIAPWQLKAIVTRKNREWAGDPAMAKYLRPETLFNKTKCEQYLGELPPVVGVVDAD